MSRRLSPVRLFALVTGVLALYSLARVMVLFFEAMSVVRSARQEDEELLVLCVAGQARGSSKMREACLKARAELASPIVFKAIVHAVSTAFKDFADAIGSPFKMLCVVLFMLSSVVLPIVPWARMLFGQSVGAPEPLSGVHYISYAPPVAQGGRFRRKVRGAMRALRLRRGDGPRIEEVDDDDDEVGHCVSDESDTGAGVGPRGVALMGLGSPNHVAVPVAGWEDVSVGAPPTLHSKWE